MTLDCSAQTISNGIRDLIKEGYLLRNHSRGCNRILSVSEYALEKPVIDIRDYGKPLIKAGSNGKSRR